MDKQSIMVAICLRRSHLQSLYRSLSHRPSLRVKLLGWLLLAAGDVEVNPGPRQADLCTRCRMTVRPSDRGIQCDECDGWTHAACCSVNNDEYERLTEAGDTQDWFCPGCTQAMLPFTECSTSLFTCLDPLATSTSCCTAVQRPSAEMLLLECKEHCE